MSLIKPKRIVIHHSDSNWGTANDIRKWHLQRGWRDIGYNFVISNGVPTSEDSKNKREFECMVGQIEYGRILDADPWIEADEVGAHAYGFNRDSIGICLIHKKGKYPYKMMSTLIRLCACLCKMFNLKPENIVGHYELDEKKPECPSIDMEKFRMHLENLIKHRIIR